jgi:hypothetical protein
VDVWVSISANCGEALCSLLLALLAMKSGGRKLTYIMMVAICNLCVEYDHCTVKQLYEWVFNKAVTVTNGLPVSLANPHIAKIIMQDNVLCDSGNINNYLWLNSCTNVPQLLLQMLCLLPINRGFMYFLSNGSRTPVITYKPIAQL